MFQTVNRQRSNEDEDFGISVETSNKKKWKPKMLNEVNNDANVISSIDKQIKEMPDMEDKFMQGNKELYYRGQKLLISPEIFDLCQQIFRDR